MSNTYIAQKYQCYMNYTSIARCARTESLEMDPPIPLLPRSLRGPVALSEHDGGESISILLIYLCAKKFIVAKIFGSSTLSPIRL